MGFSIFDNKNTMKICDLADNELRGIYDISIKMNIINIFLIAMKDYQSFADLLYDENDIKYQINKTNDFFKNQGVTENFVNLENISNSDINCFENLKKACIKIYDKDEFFKRLFKKDEMALAIIDICRIAKKMVNNA